MDLERINTATETLLDYLHPEIHPEIGKIKDIRAGLALVSSLVTVIITISTDIDTLG